jgi:hypothetical protein
MMHNSLLIRKRLRQANNDQLHRERRDPHRWLSLDGKVVPAENEMHLTGAWSIASDSRLTGTTEAVADLSDFLIRLGVTLNKSSPQKVVIGTSEDIEGDGFCLTVDEGRVELRAGGTRGMWSGVVYLEKQMGLRRAPILPRGSVERAPVWKVQISQAPYGSNYLVPNLSPEYLSDDAFRLLAHFGINGMTIYGDWLCYVDSERFPELNNPDYERNIAVLRDAADRANRYGVRLYYVPVSPKLSHDHPLFERAPSVQGSRIASGLSPDAKQIHNLCSSDPESLALHREVMGNLFKEVPDLGGLILIIGGESYYHCFMRPDRSGLPADAKTDCPRCAQSDPEDVVCELLRATAEGVHESNPDAWVMAWPYSAHWSSDPAQLELVSKLPSKVPLLTTIDKDQWMQKDGYRKLIWDYSVDYTGPADNIVKQAEILREREMPLFVKTETALGLECIQYPYMPALQCLGEKWTNVRSLRPTGVLQSWMFFGMWGSRAEELGWWANWQPEIPVEEALEKIARRDFGDSAAPVLEAWEKMSEAVSHIPYIGTYFTGPEFIGPAHPLLFDPDEDIPETFTALLYYLQENEETFSTRVSEVRHSLVMNRLPEDRVAGIMRVEDGRDVWDVVVEEYGKAVLASEQASRILNGDELAHGLPNETMLNEERLLVECVYRTFLTTLNTILFLRHRNSLRQSGGDDHRQAMVEIAERELENTRSARHVFVEAPWLDLSHRVDGEFPSSLAMVDAKISMLERALRP